MYLFVNIQLALLGRNHIKYHDEFKNPWDSEGKMTLHAVMLNLFQHPTRKVGDLLSKWDVETSSTRP
jgi:hypothetical protein